MVGVNCFGLRSGKAVCLLAEWARLFHPGDRTLAHFKLAIFKSSFLLLRSYLRLPLQPADLEKHL